MADPSVVSCAHGVVTKVATAVTSADVFIRNKAKKYWQTYRLTGSTAPAAPANPDAVNSEWLEMVNLGDGQFRPTASSDLYIYCAGEGTDAGYVRVDT